MTVATKEKITFPRMMRVRQLFKETPPVDILATVIAEMESVREIRSLIVSLVVAPLAGGSGPRER